MPRTADNLVDGIKRGDPWSAVSTGIKIDYDCTSMDRHFCYFTAVRGGVTADQLHDAFINHTLSLLILENPSVKLLASFERGNIKKEGGLKSGYYDDSDDRANEELEESDKKLQIVTDHIKRLSTKVKEPIKEEDIIACNLNEGLDELISNNDYKFSYEPNNDYIITTNSGKYRVKISVERIN